MMTDTPPPPIDPAPPDIPGHRLSRVIGRGGMSIIWLGTQRSLAREVAVKVMLPGALADEVSRRRFENEARTIARLEHPHIVGIHEIGRTHDGLPWYSMPYLPGGHVGQRDLRGDPARIADILRALLDALAFAHARGVVHRDVKAENVLFDEADRPLLADFGIALRRGRGTRVTVTGLAVGSTAYMAPEQARGEQVDHRADLYSLGVLAWEMLTGELPYKANEALAMAIAHAQNPVPKLPPPLRHWQRFIDRAMAKSPARRFHNARQMRRELDDLTRYRERHAYWLGPGPGRCLRSLGRWPRVAWIPVLLLAAGGLGLVLPGRRPASTPSTGGPAVAAPTAGNAVPSTIDLALHRAAPTSETERLLADMQRQLRAGQLLAPDGDNAADSLTAAWQGMPGHLHLPEATATLFSAFARAAAGHVARDENRSLAQLLRRADALAGHTGDAGRDGQVRLLAETERALATRIEAAAGKLDHAAAMQRVAFARDAGLPRQAVARLEARAQAIPQPGSRFRDKAGPMLLLHDGEHLFAAMPASVTRGAYAAFSNATGRSPARCRERASPLRVFDPRDWRRPGFAQGDDDAVVCVSWQDAEAYAQWLSRRSGQRYRLPTPGEASRIPPAGGPRPLSAWSSSCATDCDQRIATGTSWRAVDTERRALDPARGYDDVGFRLVRTP